MIEPRFPIKSTLGWLVVLAVTFGESSLPGQERVASEGEENLSRSARLFRDRSSEALLRNARELTAQKNYSQAVNALQAILDRDEDYFSKGDSENEYRSLKGQAREILGRMPASALRLYERQFGRAARRLLREAVESSDPEKFLQVYNRFGNTQAGLEALQRLAANYFDHGNFAAAASAFEKVVAHPQVGNAGKRKAAARLILSRALMGEVEQARIGLKDYQEEFDRSTEIGGQEVNLAEWLQAAVDGAGKQEVAEFPEELEESSELNQPSGGIELLPASDSLWDHSKAPPEPMQQLIDEETDELREYGIVSLLSFSPLAVRGTVVARTLDRLLAFEAETGRVLWEHKFPLRSSRLAEAPQLPLNVAFRDMVSDALMRQIQADSIHGSLSSDGRSVFAVQQERRKDPPPITSGSARTSSEETSPDPENFLQAFELKTGQCVWQIGKPETNAPAALEEVYFLGAPLVLGEMLYGVGEAEGELRLYVLDAKEGSLEWWRPLANVFQAAKAPPRRERLACPVIQSNGTLLCPTAAGLLIAVDLSTRSWQWGYRYESKSSGKSAENFRGRRKKQSPDQWWEGWREVGVLTDGRIVLLASPESDFLHALDLKTGKLLWKRPRRNGLFLAALAGNRAILVEKFGVRAVDIETGKTTWMARTGLPGGRGFLSSRHYVLPLDSGGMAAVRLSDGKVFRSVVKDPSQTGNLVVSGEGIFLQRLGKISRLTTLQQALSSIDVESPKSEEREDALLRKANLERETGRFVSARADFQKLLSEEEDGELRSRFFDSVLDELRRHPRRLPELQELISSLVETDEERIAYLHVRARSAAKNGQRLKALQSYFELLEAAPDGEYRTKKNPQRLVRYDRQIQGEIIELLQSASPEEKRLLEEAFQKRLKQVKQQSDPFTLQRFAQQFGQVKWGQRLRVENPKDIGIGKGLFKIQLSLLELTGQKDRTLAGQALLRLARLMEEQSYRSEAAHYYRRLRKEFGDMRLSRKQTGGEIVSQLKSSSLLKEIEQGPVDPWPQTTPRITTRTQKSSEVPLIRLPVETVYGSLYQRLNVSVDRHGKKIRFQGAGYRSYWEIDLPESSSPFRYVYSLHRGWGLGHLLVLQIGTELFCISPLDSTGEPNAEILWTLDTLDGRRPNFNRLIDKRLPAQLGIAEDRYRLIGKYERPLAEVGPVCADYLCYQEKGQLIAVDPLTGAKLWQRSDLPWSSLTVGDERFVFLFSPNDKRLEILRALDGKAIASRKVDYSPRDFLVQQGRLAVLTRERDSGKVLVALDLKSGETMWERPMSAGTVPFVVDNEVLGIFGEEGLLKLVIARTGEVLSTNQVERPDSLEEIACARDGRHYFFVFSGPIDRQEMLGVSQIRGGFRNPLVNGVLHGFDRRTGELLWKHRLDNVCFALDQPHETPFLVLSYREPGDAPQGDNQQHPEGVLKLIDKRKGELLHTISNSQMNVYYYLEAHPKAEYVDLKTPRRKLRLDYSGQPASGNEQ